MGKWTGSDFSFIDFGGKEKWYYSVMDRRFNCNLGLFLNVLLIQMKKHPFLLNFTSNAIKQLYIYKKKRKCHYVKKY